MIILGLALHGLCYDFFFVAAYIHVDNKASADIRASAQALFNLVVMGLGMWLGNILFGKLVDHFTTITDAGEKLVRWSSVWAWPTVGVIAALAIFLVGFREDPRETATPAK